MQVLPHEIKSPLELYEYQKLWIDDKSRLKIATKSRRIGFSFGAGLGGTLDCLEIPQKFIVLSRGARQAKEFITDSVAPHCRAIGVTAQYLEGYLPDSSIYKQEVRFTNGSRIIALPANPDTARSYEGDVLLDEFAFHKDSREIYQAVTPSIARGFKLGIISTPNGQQGDYYELSIKAGLVDGMPAAPGSTWSPHRVDLYQAITAGFKDRFGKLIDAALIRADCLDEDMFLQEYLCQYLSIMSQWIPPALFQANVGLDMIDADGAALCFEIGVMPIQDFKGRQLYGGWDIARNKDLSILWIFELVGDVLITRGVISMSKTPTPDQKREARRVMPFLQRLVIDKSSMGLSIYEDLAEQFGPMVEGVQFTLQTKEALAVGMKSRMESVKTRIPDTDLIRNSFRSVKKMVTATGQARFDAEHDAQYGHADHWWAAALAASGAAHPMNLGLVDFLKQVQAEKEAEMKKNPGQSESQAIEKVTTSTMQKPVTNPDTPGCPQCSSVSIVTVGGGKRCAQCGHQWGQKAPAVTSANRKDLMK